MMNNDDCKKYRTNGGATDVHVSLIQTEIKLIQKKEPSDKQ